MAYLPCTGTSRSAVRYEPQPRADESVLAGAIVRLTGQHGRYGYRLVHAFLGDQGQRVSQGRVMRIWRRESGENAIYVLFEDREEVLRRSRKNLLDDTDVDFDRIITTPAGKAG